jgi:hypothetical protein
MHASKTFEIKVLFFLKNPHGAGIAGNKRVGDRLYTEEKTIGMNSNRVKKQEVLT